MCHRNLWLEHIDMTTSTTKMWICIQSKSTFIVALPAINEGIKVLREHDRTNIKKLLGFFIPIL